jgi:hypothetical protein
MKIIWAALMVMMAISAEVHASETSGLKVFIVGEPESNDMVGGRLIYALKEQVRASQTYRLTTDPSESSIKVFVSTMNPDKGLNNRTIYSIVHLGYNLDAERWLYRNSFLGITGTLKVTESAESLMADIDTTAEILKKEVREYIENLKKNEPK